jgi:hypothetical protein
MVIDSAGNVGIGTSAPSSVLDIVSASTGVAEFNGPANATVSFTGTSFAEGKIQCGGEFTIGSTNNFPTAFVTNGTERLRIDSSGRVGIGTSSPSTTLDIQGLPGSSTTANLLTLRNQSPFSASNIAQMQFFCANSFGGGEAVAAIQALNPNAAGNNGGALVLAVSSNGTATTPTERLRIDSSGRVGIGTASPTTLLDVNADTVRVRTARTPASASATGATGEICWDASYIYVCTATNTWKRAALSTW